MAIVERTRDSVISIYREVVGSQGITLGSKEMQLIAEVFPLLRSHLGCLRGVSETRVKFSWTAAE